MYSALHTVINEYNEVRQMTLTPTKAHNQFIPALAKIPESLRLYGHGDVEVIFTDNVRADRHELEHAFPSLSENVVPVPESSTLPALTIPDKWSIHLLSSSFQISQRMNAILDSSSSDVILGMDMEWSVDRSTGMQGKVAVIQIAFDKSVYILQVRSQPLLFVKVLINLNS